MVHEQSATIVAGIIHFVIILSIVVLSLGVCVGKIEINNPIRNLEEFEIGRSFEVFDDEPQQRPQVVHKQKPPKAQKAPRRPNIKKHKPRTVKVQPTEHPMFSGCVDGLSAVGIGRGEAKREAKAFLRDMPNISSVEQFMQEYFSRRA